MNLYLATISYGSAPKKYTLVKAENKEEAENKIQKLYYNYARIAILDTIE
jgi:hypothetical protein